MCYSALVKKDMDALAKKMGVSLTHDFFERYEKLYLTDSKSFPKLKDRIYPGDFAPIVVQMGDKRVLELMRYNAFPPPEVPDNRKYTTYNARKDNLHSNFWKNAYLHNHGVILLEAFYEWVRVKDLIGAEEVTSNEISDFFKNEKQSRMNRVLAEGKIYKPTKTELQKDLDRNIIIEFAPKSPADLVVPVIFNRRIIGGEEGVGGFAIVTDDPPNDVVNAGHDRCPVFLNEKYLQEWLYGSNLTHERAQNILSDKNVVSLIHRLPRIF